MPSKCRLNQLKLARAIAVQAYKKRKIEANLVLNAHPEIKDNKLSTADISNTKDESGT